MKKIVKKNQVIITALAIMIAAAGYISYSDSKIKPYQKDKLETTAKTDEVFQDVESLEEDLTEQTSDDPSLDIPGEAVLTGADTYMAQAKVGREQIRSQNKETLLEIINNPQLTEEERQGAVASMVNMTDMVEKEAAAELLLEAKGFPGIVVNLTGETADIVVPVEQIDEAGRAQIEDIVTRKTGILPEDIVITPISEQK